MTRYDYLITLTFEREYRDSFVSLKNKKLDEFLNKLKAIAPQMRCIVFPEYTPHGDLHYHEESQRVCKAFRAKGHEAYSCDIEFCSGGKPEWHIWSDVTPLLNGNSSFRTCDGQAHYIDKWDIIIAFPPCTYLSKAGSCNLYRNGKRNDERYELGQQAAAFFMRIYNADCEKICIENPVPMKIFGLPQCSQVIEPYYFGVPVSKKTYLWLKGLPYLCPTNVIEPQYTFNTFPQFKNSFGKYRQKNRSKTFEEIAAAMAMSWGSKIEVG